MQVWMYSLVSVFVVSLISLVGVFTLSLQKEKLKKIIVYLVSFAVGGLMGDAFIHLLPEAFGALGVNLTTSLLVLSGLFLFFILEKFLRWQHCHIPTSEEHVHPVVALNLVGDAVHNFIDGMIIAASYSVSLPIGFATTLAVIFHEIPQEIGDFGILIHGGLSAQKALSLNLLSALTSVAGAVVALTIGPVIKNFSIYLIPVTAGGFLYIAGSDLIPELHQHDAKPLVSLIQLICILLGVGVMVILALME